MPGVTQAGSGKEDPAPFQVWARPPKGVRTKAKVLMEVVTYWILRIWSPARAEVVPALTGRCR